MIKNSIFSGSALLLTLATIAAAPEVHTVKEAWFTSSFPEENIDSVAIWEGAGGEQWLLATAKASHSLHVYDAVNGALIRRFGGFGHLPGQFARPNGVLVHDDLVLVVERDNHRVQVLTLPGLQAIGTFGREELIRPYGICLVPTDRTGQFTVYVTDNYETEAGTVPDPRLLGERVKAFALERTGTTLEVDWLFSFGATEGPGVLHVVESIMADPENDRLLIADEDEEKGMDLKVYGLDGRYRDHSVGQGVFQFQPEGLALSVQDGLWITTDQGKASNLFHLFDRQSLEWQATFEGERTLNTDGICFSPVAHARFPGGRFYAVDNDRAVAAFDWSEIRTVPGSP